MSSKRARIKVTKDLFDTPSQLISPKPTSSTPNRDDKFKPESTMLQPSTTVAIPSSSVTSTPTAGTPSTVTSTPTAETPSTVTSTPTAGTPSTVTSTPTAGTPSTVTSTPTAGTPSTVTSTPTAGTSSTVTSTPTAGTPSTVTSTPTAGTSSTVTSTPTAGTHSTVTSTPTAGTSSTVTSTPTAATPAACPSRRRKQTKAGPASKRPRRPLNHAPKVVQSKVLHDSGSESEDDVSDGDDDQWKGDAGPANMRLVARKLRQCEVYRQEQEEEALAEIVEEADILRFDEGLPDVDESDRLDPLLPTESEVRQFITEFGCAKDGDGATGGHRDQDIGSEAEVTGNKSVGVGAVGDVEGGNRPAGERVVNNLFSWSEDFSTFSGQEETFLRNPGPQVSYSDPTDLFQCVWDRYIVEEMVTETNRYAQQVIDTFVEQEVPISKTLDSWVETTVEEMYRLLVVLNCMSLAYRAQLDEYWTTGVLGMPEFRRIMSRNRFFMLMRFLHFVDNREMDAHLRSYERKINKIKPIIDHCTQKFTEMYVPKKHLSLDESLLLWKGNLSWMQCIESKTARCSIKSYELCEAESGYLLGCILYAGKDSAAVEGALHGFRSPTAKVAIQLMKDYLDLGHCVIMDNWYNQILLTRYLKMRGTDVIGTMDRRRQYVPPAIKQIKNDQLQRGEMLSQHCGDLTLVAWKDFSLNTVISTCHNAETAVVARRDGQQVPMPHIIADYNRLKGGVDLKDQKLSKYFFERKRGKKWYIKVFRRLLNTSFLNTYIIYTINPGMRVLTQRQFRYTVSEELLTRFQRPQVLRALQPVSLEVRLDRQGDHFPQYTASCNTGKRRHVSRRCTLCYRRGRRREVQTICSKCNVPLCFGQCWIDYHTLKTL